MYLIRQHCGGFSSVARRFLVKTFGGDISGADPTARAKHYNDGTWRMSDDKSDDYGSDFFKELYQVTYKSTIARKTYSNSAWLISVCERWQVFYHLDPS
jgi:hypothetical protein